MIEMGHLKEAVRYLEDGISDMIKEIDNSFEMIEDEINCSIGKSFNFKEEDNMNHLTCEKLKELLLKKSNAQKCTTKSTYLELEVRFLQDICNFMSECWSERQGLNEKKNHVERALSDLIKWLGASSRDAKAKTILKNLLDFVKDFDKAYNKISPLISTT